MAEKTLNIAILWHQHQPYYKDTLTGKYILPWVRLHATKDYYDMAAMAEEFPSLRLNFNLVPSLLVQLEDYASGRANDIFLNVSFKPAADLTKEERIWILHNFFLANWETMVYTYPRYGELLNKRGRFTTEKELERVQGFFSVQDMRDLQTWFNLAWMDPYWRERDELVKELYRKGRNFSEEDKTALLARQKDICGLVITKHKELMEKGLIEITTSPFYHPILPLLCNSAIAKESMPQVKLLRNNFAYPEDARTQVKTAIECYERIFGRKPTGMWPPEGSVSEEALALLADEGIGWAASDEEILFRSLHMAGYNNSDNSGKLSLFRPYTAELGQKRISMVFRHRGLSDSIGFVYSRWNEEAAVNNFMQRLEEIRLSVKNQEEPPLLTIILDGENAWEYYPNDGTEFLKRLYAALTGRPELYKTVTISEHLAANPPQTKLTKIFPGSWINADFHIWIGHEEDRTAWEAIHNTRKFLVKYLNANPDKRESPEIKEAWESLYIAEGSDWTWWYGDDHGTTNDMTFDQLFRSHLMRVYTLLGKKAPDELKVAIKRTRPLSKWLPSDFLNPILDGRVTTYFEWLGAGAYEIAHSGGTQHRAESILYSFHYGFNLTNLYIRLDATNPLKHPDLNDITFKILFLNPANFCASIQMQDGTIKSASLHNENKNETIPLNATAGKVVELALPFSTLGVNSKEHVEFVVVVEKGGLELERWPEGSSVNFEVPTEDFLVERWLA